MRILLAEDAEDYSRILIAVFKRNQIDVIHVNNGTIAYNLLKEGPLPDLLLTDVMMPGMSGFELLARLNEEKIILPTIVLTSKKGEDDVLQGLGYGAVDYITKPFSPSVVLARVKAALGRKAA